MRKKYCLKPKENKNEKAKRPWDDVFLLLCQFLEQTLEPHPFPSYKQSLRFNRFCQKPIFLCRYIKKENIFLTLSSILAVFQFCVLLFI
ncbi:hypothetical protein QVD17_35256 [Tagetes erecta]|uniref:Uncharacterized protein n=1 Tax=Tagetes erecta TaxID=13708 RepID=A0AAD8JZK8_TARER|nr:hypothetical protein QVD17_35256 [Tagetes erecta]